MSNSEPPRASLCGFPSSRRKVCSRAARALDCPRQRVGALGFFIARATLAACERGLPWFPQFFPLH